MQGKRKLVSDGQERLSFVDGERGGIERSVEMWMGRSIARKENGGDVAGAGVVDELFEVGMGRVVRMAFEDLDCVDAGIDLEVDEVEERGGERCEWIVVEVGGDGVGRADEANQRHSEGLLEGADGRCEERERLRRRCAGDARPFREGESEAEGERDDCDVGKEDGGVKWVGLKGKLRDSGNQVGFGEERVE